MKKWIFSTFILTIALGTQPLRADGEIDGPPPYSEDSKISREQQNQIFSVFSVYREKKDQEEAVKGIAGLGLNTRQIGRVIDDIDAQIAETDKELVVNLNFIVAKESQIEILKAAQERVRFIALAEVLKGYGKIKSGVRALVREEISKPWTSHQPDLHINIETLKRFATYIDSLPLADQIVIQEGAINQLEYLIGEATNKRDETQQQIKNNDANTLVWPTVGTVGGAGWVRILSKDSFFYSRKGIITAAITAVAMGGTTLYLQNKQGGVLAALLAADQKELDALKNYIAESRADLADLKEALKVNGGEAPTAEAEVSALPKP